MADIDPNEVINAARQQQERAMAIEAILNNASEIGIEEALSRFGSTLTTTEKELLKTLTTEELSSLKSIMSKLGSQILFQPCGILF